MLVKDKDHRFVASNVNFSQYSGVSPELLIGLNDSELARVSLNAYDFHLKNLRLKFSANSIDDLIWQCYQRGFHHLIPSPVIINYK
ncbi:PAS domain-containing protein [Erwinia toletana]|uniref:PAS domain-containing protein n=1 Tax=Winslowiella toletana TaxID=92490 RepID=A0ABS4PEZ8_9GAMM|nr:PAS domain-containing protein [Winslowiella toletana]